MVVRAEETFMILVLEIRRQCAPISQKVQGKKRAKFSKKHSTIRGPTRAKFNTHISNRSEGNQPINK